MKPLFETNYLGFWIKVYKDRVEFKDGVGSKSVPLSQIASITTHMMGVMKITIETTGGQKYNIPTLKKKEVREAIYKARDEISNSKSDNADDIEKLHSLKEKGIISEEEFKKKKSQILGI